MIKRQLEKIIRNKLNTGKVILVLGPRQTGKTTLLSEIVQSVGPFLMLNCDDFIVRSQLTDASVSSLTQIIGSNKLLFIDEAQRVKNIGLTLKLIADTFKDIQLLVSGSSALELADEINEPLTGRKWEYRLFPISFQEFYNQYGYLEVIQQLEHRIIFGMYPEVLTNRGNEIEVLKLIADSYLYKDLLSYKGIRKPDVLQKLLVALALQLGNEVSYNELSNLLQIDKNTVVNYIDLLEKAFVVFRLQAFSRNLRNEISNSRKIYFYDNGIRNILINNLNALEYRNDTGALWENFLISERMKYNHYNFNYCNSYFWRTHQKQEIDYIEESGGQLYAFEFKWNENKKVKVPSAFNETYKNHTFSLISRQNFIEFLHI